MLLIAGTATLVKVVVQVRRRIVRDDLMDPALVRPLPTVAIGVLGGYVAGSKSLIEFLYHRARPFLFSTSHPPAVTAACLAALDRAEAERLAGAATALASRAATLRACTLNFTIKRLTAAFLFASAVVHSRSAAHEGGIRHDATAELARTTTLLQPFH